jgi:hypothetical protein
MQCYLYLKEQIVYMSEQLICSFAGSTQLRINLNICVLISFSDTLRRLVMTHCL